MKKIFIKTNFIKLGQFLKFTNVIQNGSDSKEFLLNNIIYVNDEIENRRGRKLFNNDKVKIFDNEYLIVENGKE